MAQRPKGTGKRREDKVAVRSFVVPSGDTAKMLDTVEESLDQIAGAIQGAAVASLADPVRARRNHGLRACGANQLYEGIGVVAFVRDDRVRGKPFDQLCGAGDVGSLTVGENQPQRPPKGIDCQMQFGTQPAAGASDRLRATFFGSSVKSVGCRRLREFSKCMI